MVIKLSNPVIIDAGGRSAKHRARWGLEGGGFTCHLFEGNTWGQVLHGTFLVSKANLSVISRHQNDSVKNADIHPSPNARLFTAKAQGLWHACISQCMRITGKQCQLLFWHYYILHMLSDMLKCSWQVNPSAALFLSLTLVLQKVFLCTSSHRIPQGRWGCRPYENMDANLKKTKNKNKPQDIIVVKREQKKGVLTWCDVNLFIVPQNVCGLAEYAV